MIRILAKRDFSQYIQLVKTFRPIDDYICQGGFNEIYDYIFQNSKIFVYVIDKEIVGSVTVLIEKKFIHNFSIYIHLEDLIVHPNYQKQNIGSELLDFAIQYCKHIKAKKIIINCDTELVPFYEKKKFMLDKKQMKLDL